MADEVRIVGRVGWVDGPAVWGKNYNVPTARLLLNSPVWVQTVLERTEADCLQVYDKKKAIVDLRDDADE